MDQKEHLPYVLEPHQIATRYERLWKKDFDYTYGTADTLVRSVREYCESDEEILNFIAEKGVRTDVNMLIVANHPVVAMHTADEVRHSMHKVAQLENEKYEQELVRLKSLRPNIPLSLDVVIRLQGKIAENNRYLKDIYAHPHPMPSHQTK